ncbi:MAG TPA: tetratricopeptide repeat protein, partial [bacterium]|nr:tetratricopeptide repeat protein [bacterium]
MALEKYKQKMFEKGDYEQKIKDYQKAYKTFFKLIEFDKGYVPAYRELIKLGAMLNQLPELENLINSYKTQKLTIVEHSAIEYAEALILTYQKNWKNNLNAALKKVQGAISLKKNVSYYYQLAGWILEQLELQADKYGKYEDSLNNYKIALGLADPENIQNRAELIMNIANVYYHLQNYEFAYRYYAEYEKLSANLKYQDKNILEIFYANYAYSAYVINLYELAEKNYRRAIELTNNAEHKEMYYKKLSLIYYSSARFLEAVQALETANSIAVDTKNLSAAELELRKYYNNRAILLYLMNYLKEHPEISELEKAKLKNKIIELLEKTEQHFNLGFQQLKAKKEGLINLRINIADEGTDNAEGFNPTTEQKFLYMLASGFYQFYNNNQKSIDYLKKRLELLPQKIIIDKMPIAALEQAILLNSIGIEYYRINDLKNSIDYIDSSLNIALQLKDEFGITNNLLCALKILDEQKEKVPLTDFSIKLENYYKNYASSNIANFFSNYRVASAFAYLYYYIYNQMSAAQTKLFNDFEKIQNIEDQIKILKQLKDIYSHQQRALKLLLDLKTKFARQNPNDGLLKIFAEINNANISELTDTRIISNLLDWLNFADINDFEKLCEFENLFLQFNQNTQKYRQYNFVSRQLLNIFYDKLIRSAFDNKDAIKFCLFIDHYQMLINQRLDNFKTINILADEDIYYFQSLLADNQNINIIYYSEYAKKYYACSLNNTDFKLIGVFENLDNLPKSDNLLIVNAAADNFLNANLIIPSIAAYIKSSKTRTVFYNKLQKYENINYSNNAIFDTNIDILVFDAAPILSSSQNIGKLKFKDNIELELKAIKEQNPQINYLVLKYGDSYFKNNINNLNHFAEYLIFSGFANILFLNEIDIDKINNNTDISQYLTKGKIYGAGAYSETQRMELARTINEELINNFVEHFQTSNFSTALYYIERIIGLANVLAPSDTELSSYLKLAVDCAYKLQDYKLAAFYQHKILSAGKLDAWQLAQELYKLGIFYANAESYDSSIYYFNQALRYYPDDTKFVSNIKIELSKSNEFKSEYQNAIKYIESAINSTIEFEELGKLYLRLGKIYYLRLNNYILAEEYFYKALDYFKKISDNKNICRALIDIGLVNERLAKFTVSREFYEQALTFARKNNFENMHSEILLNIANTHWFEGNYRNALTYSFNSLDLAKKNNDQMQIYLAMNTIGLIYWSVNDKDKAIYYLENSLALSSALKNYNDVSSTYNNLGIVHRSWKNYPEAEYYFNQALEIDKILKSKWAIGYDYRNLGMLKLAANDLKSAEKFLNDAYQLSVEIKNNINLVKCSLELGNLNLKLAKNKIAFEWFDKTQQQAKEYSMKEIVWRALYGKALAILETDKKQALEYLIEAVEIVENLRADLKIEELTNGFFFDKKDLFDNIIELYVDLQNPQK